MLKLCKYCNTEQPEDKFPIAAIINGKTYKRHKCQSCKLAQQKQRRQRMVVRVADYKKTLARTKCGFADYRALEFHHVDPSNKEFAVSDFIIRGVSWAKIEREIKKCVVLCANCHRIEHCDNGM